MNHTESYVRSAENCIKFEGGLIVGRGGIYWENLGKMQAAEESLKLVKIEWKCSIFFRLFCQDRGG